METELEIGLKYLNILSLSLILVLHLQMNL